MNLLTNIIINFKLFSKSRLPSDVDSIQVAFNSMFINGPDQNHFLAVTSTKREWETMSTLDLGNLTNQLAHTLDESPERKITKFVNFQLWGEKALVWANEGPYMKPKTSSSLLLLQRPRTLEKRLPQT